MRERSEQNQHHDVIPFPKRDPAVREHDHERHQLIAELLMAVREGTAMAGEIVSDEWDRQVIADERAFIARFGFDRPRRYRESLIQLKHAVDLTDREIRLMGFTSSLRFDAHGVQLAASRGIAVFGRGVICLLALQMLYAWLLAAHSNNPAPILVLKLAGVAVMLVSMGWCVHQLYVRPWLIQKRARDE